jgi:hypothetical protein
METPNVVIDRSGSHDSLNFDRIRVEDARVYYRSSGFEPSFEASVEVDGGGRPLRANPLWAACVSRLSVWDLLLGMSSIAHPHRRLADALGVPTAYVMGFLDAWYSAGRSFPPVDVLAYGLGLDDGQACRAAFQAEE